MWSRYDSCVSNKNIDQSAISLQQIKLNCDNEPENRYHPFRNNSNALSSDHSCLPKILLHTEQRIQQTTYFSSGNFLSFNLDSAFSVGPDLNTKIIPIISSLKPETRALLN